MIAFAIAAFLAAGPAAETDHGLVLRAMELAAAAQAEGSAENLRMAARLLQATGAAPQEGTPDLAGEWLAAADAMDPQTEAAAPDRGRAVGPGYRRGVATPAGAVEFSEIFYAGQSATVSLQPTAEADLILQVTDSDGGEICQRSAQAASASCQWIPAWTAPYQITVRNTGARETAYYLVTN